MSWIAVGIGAAVGVAGGAIYGSQKGGDAVWKDALIGGTVGALGGAGAGALMAPEAAAAAAAPEAIAAEGGIGALATEGGVGTLAGSGAMSIPGVGAASAAPIAGTSTAVMPGAATIGTGAAGSAVAPGAAPVVAGGGIFGGAAPTAVGQVGAYGGAAGGAGAGAGAGAGGAGAGGTGLGGWWGGLSSLEKAGIMGAGTLGLGYAINQENQQYGVPDQPTYTGPLSKLNYDPEKYKPSYATPNVYQPRYADGGIASLSDGSPMNPMANSIYPQSQQQNTAFATSPQMPNSMRSAMASDYDVRTNPSTGAELPMGMAEGGIADLGGYSDGGRLLRGPGDGVSDSIPAQIGRRQPARLADGEFVVPARAVSELGNGSTDAGAKQLYRMLDRIESKRKKGKGLAYQANPKKIMPA